MTTRKNSKELKLNAISLVNDQDHNMAETARNLGVPFSLLGKWIREAGKMKV